jgi:integrase
MVPQESPLRPHVLCDERLMKWRPYRPADTGDINPELLRRAMEVMAAGWAPGTHGTYGSGLLMFHVWCDKNGIAEERRAPVEEFMLHAFIGGCAGGYSKSAVENALLGLRAWHLLHKLAWPVDMKALRPLLTGVENLAPPESKRPPRDPLRLALIERIATLIRESAFDLAWWACLLTTFWSCSRLGEFTVKDGVAFDPRYHIARGRVSNKSRDGDHIKDFFLPWTKVAKTKGEHVFWATQPGAADPLRAFVAHLAFNDPPDEGAHLFSYRDGTSKEDGSPHYEPMRRSAFLGRMNELCAELGETPPNGHSIRIGSILEYLLRGTEFAVGKVIGRWGSDAFEGYLRDHALVLAPYLQARPRIEAQVAAMAMPMPMPRRLRR